MVTDNTSNITRDSDGELKTVKLGSFLTEKQLEDAIGERTAVNICAKVVKPNIEEINKKIGQRCDPMYLSYMLEYAFMSIRTSARGA